MIAEIALNRFDKTRGSVRYVEPGSQSDFIMDTVKRIYDTPLDELESRLPEYIQKRNQNAFVLGGVLERIRREKFWNPGSGHAKNALFERWVEDTCHYSGRKARYLISVYLGLVHAAIPSSMVSEVGWSKLRMIAPLLRPIRGQDADTVSERKAQNDELLRLARRKSRKALEAALRSMSENGEPFEHESTRAPRRYVFKIQSDAAEAVDTALDLIAKETGHTGGAALVDLAKSIDTGDGVPLLEQVMRKAGREASLATYVRLFGPPAGR
jgi:hypothetical protein